jgi:putative NADH-flavin reductase
MNLIVFGATGGTGRHVVAQALSAGHTVTAVARRSDLLNKTHEQLHVVRGDVFEPATFIQGLAGQDAVVSALGVRSQTPTTLFSAGVAQIMCAMHMHGVNTHLSRGWSISRADLADYIVTHISDPAASRAIIEVAT